MAWLKRKWLPILTHVGALLPLARLIWNFFHDQLTANPIQYITFQTGKSALVLLVLALACTPLNTVFELKRVVGLRKTLGLYAFLYATLHFLTFVGLDYQFDPELLKEAIFKKRYALGRVRCIFGAASVGHHFDQRMDEAIGQELEAPSPSHLSRCVAGGHPFRLAGEVRHSGTSGLRRGCRFTAGAALEDDSESTSGSAREACSPTPRLQSGCVSRRPPLTASTRR